jgi:hypothetical protein
MPDKGIILEFHCSNPVKVTIGSDNEIVTMMPNIFRVTDKRIINDIIFLGVTSDKIVYSAITLDSLKIMDISMIQLK